MKVTKYPQSNFLIESKGSRILIDPGYLTFEKFNPSDFGTIQAVLITHQHPDHLEKQAARAFSGSEVPIYGNNDVASVLSKQAVEVNLTEPDKEFQIAGFNIRPIDIPHCQMLYCTKENKTLTAIEISSDKKCKNHPNLNPKYVDGPPNTGFVINGVLFHPGDGIELATLKVENAFIPINGPTIDFDRAWAFVDSLQAKQIIPMHYSHPTFLADPESFAGKNKGSVRVIILKDGESTEI